jgi:uncharacterized protein YndB with AHSA1/START domain
MAVIRRSQVINAPIDQVFDALVDGTGFASWNPTIRSSRQLDDGPPAEGTRFEWDLRGFGKVIHGDATRIDHELEMRPKGAFVLLAPMMGAIGRKNLKDTSRALQTHVEPVAPR